MNTIFITDTTNRVSDIDEYQSDLEGYVTAPQSLSDDEDSAPSPPSSVLERPRSVEPKRSRQAGNGKPLGVKKPTNKKKTQKK